MRLVTYSKLGVPSIGIELQNGDVIDIPDLALRYGKRHQVNGYQFPQRMKDLLQWELGIKVVKQVLSSYEHTPKEQRLMPHAKTAIKLEAPVQNPGKIVALGLNYRDHIEETGREVPESPVIFAKFPSSIVGPDDSIPIPKVTEKLDWEVELGVVIGKKCKEVSEQDALNYVAGYTIINDLSARDVQRGDGQWVRGKSLDGLCPMGPCIVTTDEIGDGSNLKMYTKVNGNFKQKSNTSNLLFNVKQIISFLSQSFTLEPGDIIATGTPSGVGFARDPPEFLKPGDIVELYIERIGYLKNTILSSV
jgi:acylpyruvate hydrolase